MAYNITNCVSHGFDISSHYLLKPGIKEGILASSKYFPISSFHDKHSFMLYSSHALLCAVLFTDSKFDPSTL